jgi:two-component system sensor histidine kinase KdpD
MVSHELKTPLTVVTGAIDAAQIDGITREEARGLLQDAAWGAHAMADIVDNLLELSRWQSKRLILQASTIDVGQVITGVVARSRQKSAKHRILMDVPPELECISADELRVERVLDNLVDNAIKYSPEGGEVRVSARKEPGHIIIGVSDQGIGISASDAGKLFEPFSRLETLPGSAVQGVGLGLVVCRRLVEAHGGRIWLESERGKGTTFYFTLPCSGTEQRA